MWAARSRAVQPPHSVGASGPTSSIVSHNADRSTRVTDIMVRRLRTIWNDTHLEVQYVGPRLRRPDESRRGGAERRLAEVHPAKRETLMADQPAPRRTR